MKHNWIRFNENTNVDFSQTYIKYKCNNCNMFGYSYHGSIMPNIIFPTFNLTCDEHLIKNILD